MDFYEEMGQVADSLLGTKEFGRPFTLRKQSEKPVYNPKTKKTETTYTDYPGTCVMKTYTDEEYGALNNILEAGDVSFICVMKDISIIPQKDKDKLVFNGVTYNIVRPAITNPSGDRILVHKLQCRKAGE